MPTRYSRSTSKITDPYCFLALAVFFEIFRAVDSYFSGEIKDPEEVEEVKDEIEWLKNADGNFKILAIGSNMSLNTFHRICIQELNERQHKYEQKRLEEQN